MGRHNADTLYRCPHCGDQAVRVVDSRPLEASPEQIIRRRRVCRSCGQRWSTYEITDATYAAICETADVLKKMFPHVHRRSVAEHNGAVSDTTGM